MVTYADKLKDPRWQKKRLEILQRDMWTCQYCYDNESMLVVHHTLYIADTEPWDYPDSYLITLCEECHTKEREERPEEEKRLLEIFRLLFSVDDIKGLASCLEEFTLLHAHDVVASVYGWAFSSPSVQRDLIDKYFEHLEKEARSHNAKG